MKKIVVSEIPEEGLEYDLSEWIKAKDIVFLNPVRGYLKVLKTGSDVVIQGSIKTSINLQCSRCTEPFEYVISTILNTTFYPAKTLTRDEHYELHDDELETEFYSNDVIDIYDFITQEVVLNIPMKPLCNDMCKGICPHCGTELNKETCTCANTQNENAFSILDKIIIRKEQ